MSPLSSSNPLLEEWTGPYGGVPPFDAVRIEHFAPALEVGMREMLVEVDRIAGEPEPPTFANTVEALERAGRCLARVRTIYGIWGSSMTTAEFLAVEREMNPRIAAHSDRIRQNQDLFRRLEAVCTSPEIAGRPPDQQRLAWLYYSDFVRRGATLDAEDRRRVSEINEALSGLFTTFRANVLADEEHFVLLESESDLAGLPRSFLDAAAESAARRGLGGGWVIANIRSATETFLTYSERRDLRERVWRLFAGRGEMGGERDNRPIVEEIVGLRAERARLLGYRSHAHLRLAFEMAGTPERALELMDAVWPPAMEKVREDLVDILRIVDEEGGELPVEPWDYRFYAEKLRGRRFDLDQVEVMQYLPLDGLCDAMFWVARELFGLEFRAVGDVPVFHEDVRVWAVRDRSGRHVGLWYFDPFTRSGKRSGAWMSVYRPQERLDGEVPTLVSNVMNVSKGAPGEPVLLSWSDASTLFHEFGHALNGLASDVVYPMLSGLPPERDYVEFPSQILEYWLSTPEVLRRFATHHRTGEPMPEGLMERLQRAATFNQGLKTIEYLASALVDMQIHLSTERPADIGAIERDLLAARGLPPEVRMLHRPPHFSHLFAGENYSASYYSYLWADMLAADAFEAFTENGGAYDRDVARRLVEHVFSVGSAIAPAESFRRFRGRDPRLEPLMRRRGFLL